MGCGVDLSDEQLEMLFDADFARSTESTRFTFTAPDGENSEHTIEYCYFSFDPQQIMDVLRDLLEDSYAKVPQRKTANSCSGEVLATCGGEIIMSQPTGLDGAMGFL